MSLRPETFENDLTHRLGPDYRLRWSNKKETYCIEQRLTRPPADIPMALRGTDLWIRHRDRYALVCEVSPSPWMRCSKCRTRLRVPDLKWAEVKCPTCYASRTLNNTQYFVAYFPLCERLLQHLESTSPQRGWEWVKRLRTENAQVVETQDRDWRDHSEQGLLSYRNLIADNPTIGYGRGPASFGARNRM